MTADAGFVLTIPYVAPVGQTTGRGNEPVPRR